MATGSFDYYYLWLGIPAEEQPPHLYRLLGLTPFESNPDVIEASADRQMAHVRTFQSGPHSRESQKVLNELSAARLMLLNLERKAAYDQQLRAQLASDAGGKPVLMAESLDLDSTALNIDSELLAAHHVHLHPVRKQTAPNWPVWSGLAMAGALALGIAVWLAVRRGPATVMPPAPVAQPEPAAPPQPQPEAKPAPAPVSAPAVAAPSGPLPLDPSVASLPGAGGTITNPTDGSVLVFIPAGKALVGENRVEVNLPAYYIGQHEVTNEQYKRFVDAISYRPPDQAQFGKAVWSGKSFPPEKARHPVVCIDWEDAAAYCRWAELRLPSVLEWQKAARGVDGRVYPWGNTLEPDRCCCGRLGSSQDMDPVMSYPAGRSPWGVFDLAGNALEWTADWFDPSVFQRYQTGDLAAPVSGRQRTVMGGSRINQLTDAHLRSDCYKIWPLRSGMSILGFRVAKSVPESKPNQVAAAPSGTAPAVAPDTPSSDMAPPESASAAAVVAPAAVTKRPPPDATSQAQAEAAIRAAHQAQFDQAGKSESAKQKLAAALLAEANQAGADPARQFKSLRLAYDLAREVLDTATVFAAVDALDAGFKIDAVSAKVVYGESAVKQDLKEEPRKTLSVKLADAAQQALDLQQFDAADRALKLARRALRGLDRKLVERLDALVQQVKTDRKDFEPLQKARDTLQSRPEDPPANSLVGWWLCQRRADWAQGLTHLARGDDVPLKALAARDLAAANPQSAEALALGDAWWDFSKSLGAGRTDAARARAGYWYGRALPELTDGADKTRALERLGQAAGGASAGVRSGALPADQWSDVRLAVNPRRDVLDGLWETTVATLGAAQAPKARLMLPVTLRGAYDLEVTFVRQVGSGRLGLIFPVGTHQTSVALHAGPDHVGCLFCVGNWGCKSDNPTAKPGVIENGRPHTLLISVRPADRRVEVQVLLDNQPYLAWNGGVSSIGIWPEWCLPLLFRPGLVAEESVVAFTSIRVRPVAQQAMQPGSGEVLAPHAPLSSPYTFTPLVPSGGGSKFCDSLSTRVPVVGLRVWIDDTDQHLCGIQAVFQTPQGNQFGLQYQGARKPPVEILAKEGYALAGLIATRCSVQGPGYGGAFSSGLKPIFMRLQGDRLNPKDSYSGDWIGAAGAQPTTLGGNGALVVGLHGTWSGSGIRALGLVQSH